VTAKLPQQANPKTNLRRFEMKTNVSKIKKELENGFGKKHMRYGIEYAWYNAAALDAGIMTRAKNAKKWREEVVKLSEKGEVTEEKVTAAYDGMKKFSKKATAYYLNGELKLLVSRGKMLDTKNYKVLEET
jgi:hypothetical protein